MYSVDLSITELSALISTLEIEEWRISHYYGALMQCGNTEMTSYDRKRLEDINDLIVKLKEKRGGH